MSEEMDLEKVLEEVLSRHVHDSELPEEVRDALDQLAKEVKRLRRDEAIAWGIHFCCNGQDCGCGGLPVDPPLWWTPDVKKLQEEIAQMREALRGLYREVYGMLGAFRPELIQVVSITNIRCVEHRLEIARAALP